MNDGYCASEQRQGQRLDIMLAMYKEHHDAEFYPGFRCCTTILNFLANNLGEVRQKEAFHID